MTKHINIAWMTAALLLAGPWAGADLIRHSIDFSEDANGNTLTAGQVIDDEFADWGLNISVVNKGGGPDIGVLFDSQDPTGGDPDLASPSSIGNAKDDVLGNLLIIQEDGYNDNGFLSNNDPDDEAGGGQIIFDFDMLVTEFGFHVVDIEANGKESTYYAEFFRGDTSLEKITFADLTTIGDSYYDATLAWGDNSINKIAPFVVDQGNGFDKVVINFGGSGAVDNIEFAVVPEPATMVLLGGGLAAMAVRYRRKRAAK